VTAVGLKLALALRGKLLMLSFTVFVPVTPATVTVVELLAPRFTTTGLLPETEILKSGANTPQLT
jgi:hypothetical protein